MILRRLGVETEVEGQLAFAVGLQLAQRHPERHAALQIAVDLAQQADVLERELGAAVCAAA